MIELSADTEALKALGRALGAEADGKQLRRGLAKEMRGALAPAVAQARSGVMSMSSGGLPASGPPLRAAIARQIKAEARLSGRATGARVKAKKKSMPRGFANAPKRTNSVKGWRHPLPARRRRDGSMTDPQWVAQRGRPGWFDDPMNANRSAYRAAVLRAMNDTARRIVRKV